MKNNIIILVFIAILFSSCSSNKPTLVFEKPAVQIPKAKPKVKNNKGSLYSMRGASLFADKKDLQVGDIIQIEIDEGLTSNSNNNRKLTSTRNSSLGGGVLAATGTNTLGNTVGNIAGKLNRNLGVDFSTSSSSSDNGTTATTFDESFETTISAIIEQTYKNGNYYIKGSKELLIEGQKQEIIVSGVIRPYDITSDNSINSSQIANLKILYNKEGEDAEMLEIPWGTKVMRYIWPF